MYKITKNRLVELLAAELELVALKCGGVDNWEWSGASCEDELNCLSSQYNLDREDLTFLDVAGKMVEEEWERA